MCYANFKRTECFTTLFFLGNKYDRATSWYNPVFVSNDVSVKLSHLDVVMEFYIYIETGFIFDHMALSFIAVDSKEFEGSSKFAGVSFELGKATNRTISLHRKLINKDRLNQSHGFLSFTYFSKLNRYHVKTSVNHLIEHSKTIWRSGQFEDYDIFYKNCQDFAKRFLHSLGIGFWWSGFSDGFHSGPRVFLVSVLFAVAIGLLFAAIGARWLGRDIGGIALVIGVNLGALMSGAIFNRDFSTDQRRRLFEKANEVGISVIDDRSQLLKLFDTIVGY